MKSDFYTHDKFTDVMFFLKRAFYIKEKDLWELKVTWWNVRGWELGEDKLYVSPAKIKEFKRL